MSPNIVFIGGGNMAGAIIRGLLHAGCAAQEMAVVEPVPAQRERLQAELGVTSQAVPDVTLAGADVVVWAVKPQSFEAAAAACGGQLHRALHLSVMAGVRSQAIARASGSARVVRAMPNTPALMGEGIGIAGLFAAETVSSAERQKVEALLAPTGALVWVEREADLDAVTALSGSGPAYFFYLVEAMTRAGVEMGLDVAQARQLSLATCRGAAMQALASGEDPSLLRERVTSKGGTTEAAVRSLEQDGVADSMRRAVLAAQLRARQLGDEFSR